MRVDVPAAVDNTAISNARLASHPSTSSASVDGQEPRETAQAISALENAVATSLPVHSDLPDTPRFLETDAGMVKPGQPSDSDNSLQSYAFPRSLDAGAAPAADLLVSVRKIVVAWFGRYGISRPPPCAVHVTSAKLVYKGSTGMPTLYHHKNGLRLDVRLFRFMQFPRSIRNVNDIIVVASNPNIGSFIMAVLVQTEVLTDQVLGCGKASMGSIPKAGPKRRRS